MFHPNASDVFEFTLTVFTIYFQVNFWHEVYAVRYSKTKHYIDRWNSGSQISIYISKTWIYILHGACLYTISKEALVVFK